MKPAFFIAWVIGIFMHFLVFVDSDKKSAREVNPVQCQEVTILPSYDSAFMNPVMICGDSSEQFFYSEVESAVCQDELCRLVYLKIYWDLAGYYARFEIFEDEPLTKNDHIEFSRADYDKLHDALKDPNSILGEKTKEELLDKSKERYSEKIDGYTGATAKEIKEVVVDGALYSTFTLWNLVNGDIRSRLKDHTKAHLNEQKLDQLLDSENPRTVQFGLKNMGKEDYVAQFPKLLTILARGNGLVNFYLVKKIPAEAFAKEANQAALKAIWENLDLNTRSVLERKMQDERS